MHEVVMPQMGESIAEGTIIRWIKHVGDKVDRDEPLFEISTDKVDAEIPAPAAGVLTEIRAKEGDTVPVNSVVAVIGDAGAAAASGGPASREEPKTRPSQQEQVPSPVPAEAAKPESAAVPPGTRAEGRRRSSPLVRRIAREQNIDVSRIAGSGLGGRVTKRDILEFASRQPSGAALKPPAVPGPAVSRPQFKEGENVAIVPMTVMRRKIAEHMVLSQRTSAHVHSVFEVDFSRVATLRHAKKQEYERAGATLTYMAFIVKAAVDALRAVPIVNASLDGDNIVYRKEINIGVAVALDWGLIVPVITKADEKNLIGLSRSIGDLAGRARSKQLRPDEVLGGTFTITNPGVFGTLFGMPIINQPQVAILGVGAIEKRPVVIDDAITVRTRAYLSLGYDHRLIDGAVADQFMSVVKKGIEEFDPAGC
jgi:2-oxoglutarate dehydrogenase E2 component (dihydrolipoamide succinyltransferase)